jgi:putative glutamine amidotransferase
MKRIFMSQRVDIVQDYGERRDALDQKWAELLWELNHLCVPISNHIKSTKAVLKMQPPDGIILTGGNNHCKYGGNAPERDAVDELLISYAVTNSIPLLGVCRGMQSIVLHFGGTLRKVEGHVAIRHALTCEREVNSYHAYSADELPKVLVIQAKSEDGAVEQIQHEKFPIYGVMWHPEREESFDAKDIKLIKAIFKE